MWETIAAAVAPTIVSSLFGSEEAEDNRYAQQQVNETNVALSRETQARNEQLARDMAAQNERLQREFAQMGIQWRVKDAEAAGLHPLYALSGGGAAYSPSPTIVHTAPRVDAPEPSRWQAEMGQNLGRALNAALDPVQRAERALQLKLLEAQTSKEDAQAQYFRSMAVRETGGPGGGLPSIATVGAGTARETLNVIDLPALHDTIKAVPREVESSRTLDPSSTPGTAPLFSDYTGPGGITVRLPSKGASEPLESIEPLGALLTIGENLRYHTQGLVQKALDFLLEGGYGRAKVRVQSLINRGKKEDPLPGRRYSPHHWTGGKFN